MPFIRLTTSDSDPCRPVLQKRFNYESGLKMLKLNNLGHLAEAFSPKSFRSNQPKTSSVKVDYDFHLTPVACFDSFSSPNSQQ